MMRSVESASSVFYHSQEEDPAKTSVDSQGSCRDALSGPLCDSYHDSMIDSSPATTEQEALGNNTVHASKMGLSIPIIQISALCSDECKIYMHYTKSINEGLKREAMSAQNKTNKADTM